MKCQKVVNEFESHFKVYKDKKAHIVTKHPILYPKGTIITKSIVAA